MYIYIYIEMVNTVIESTYTQPQTYTRAVDTVFRMSRFHDIALEPMPIRNGAYALRALVVQQVADFLSRTGYSSSTLAATLCVGHPSSEQACVDMEGRADVKQAAATRFSILR